MAADASLQAPNYFRQQWNCTWQLETLAAVFVVSCIAPDRVRPSCENVTAQFVSVACDMQIQRNLQL